MKLTPLDIRKQEFKKTLRGFDPIEVQTFLEMVGEEYEQVLEKNKQLNNHLIELETKLKDFQENEKNLRETLFNVQEVKKQSEESSRKQADLVIKEAELKALEIIEMARKQARQMRDEVSMLKTQKESFINRLRQILISQIELLSVLEIDDALPEEAFRFLENARSRKKIALQGREDTKEKKPPDDKEPLDIEFAVEETEQSGSDSSEKSSKKISSEEKKKSQKSEEDKSETNQESEQAQEEDISKKVDD
jgi:cell division initiation protein